MSHEWNCRCGRCDLALKNDLAISCGDQDPATLEEEMYGRAHELTSLETLRGLSE